MNTRTCYYYSTRTGKQSILTLRSHKNNKAWQRYTEGLVRYVVLEGDELFAGRWARFKMQTSLEKPDSSLTLTSNIDGKHVQKQGGEVGTGVDQSSGSLGKVCPAPHRPRLARLTFQNRSMKYFSQAPVLK